MLNVILTVMKEYEIQFSNDVSREDVVRDALEEYFCGRLVPSVFRMKADVYEGQEKMAEE